MTATSRLRRRTSTAFRPRLTALEDRSVPSFGWASAVGGDSAAAVATDAAGDAYLTGRFSGSFTPAGSSSPLTSAGGTDIFVAKYSRAGNFLWAVSLGGVGEERARGIAVDTAGTAVHVAGDFNGGYAAKIDAGTGAVVWTRAVTGTAADAVAVDTAGNAYVTSRTGNDVAYVTKLDAAGAQQWQDRITGSVYFGLDVAVSGGAVYVGGTFITGATVTVGSTSYSLTTKKNLAAGYVLKLGTNNAYGWAKTFQPVSSGGNVWRARVAADPAGNVYATGEFQGSVNFAGATKGNSPWTLIGSSDLSNQSAYVTKLSPTGGVLWATVFGTGGGLSAEGHDIAVDAAGAVYLAGRFGVTKYSTAGAFQWTVQAGTARSLGVAVNPFGEVYVAGYIGAGTTDFDPANVHIDNRDLLTGPTGFLWQITQP